MSKSIKVYGSVPSPYVRRIRMLLAPYDHEFHSMDIFAGQGRELMKSLNPANKVPVLTHGDVTILDSANISAYLMQHFDLPSLTWSQRNTLASIDAVNESFVNLLLCERSGIELTDAQLFYTLQSERIESVMQSLEKQINEGVFNRWDYVSMSLYALLDWIEFRELYASSQTPAFKTFLTENRHQLGVEETDPRR